MKVYITKYALVRGIYELEVTISSSVPSMVSEKENSLNVFHRPHWHETKEAAIEQVNKMRNKKITSIKKQLARLEKMTF